MQETFKNVEMPPTDPISIKRKSIGSHRLSLTKDSFGKKQPDPKAKFEKELFGFLNQKMFKRVIKETESYRFPPIVHIHNKLNSDVL
jgi:hypothetical protein